MFENIKFLYNNNPKEFFYRLILIILSSLILPNIILIIFLIYMGHENFFSYDFFTDGVFGMKVFFILTLFSIFAISLTLFGYLIVLLGKKKYKYLTSKVFIWLLFINISTFLVFVIGVCFRLIQIEWFLFISIISLIICFHLSMILFYDAKHQLISFLLSMSLIFAFSIMFSGQTVRLLSMALKSFGIGGYINIKLTIKDGKIKKGKLVLLTPKTVYIKPFNHKAIEIFQIDHIESIYIGDDINISKTTTR